MVGDIDRRGLVRDGGEVQTQGIVLGDDIYHVFTVVVHQRLAVMLFAVRIDEADIFRFDGYLRVFRVDGGLLKIDDRVVAP